VRVRWARGTARGHARSHVEVDQQGQRVSSTTGVLGVPHGAALYVGSLIGPGVLLVPALAVDAAGPASVIGWALLLVLSAPLALTFARLGTRLPVSGGVAEYVRAGFGDLPAAVTGGWFLTAVLIGAPAVSLIGGYYVADLTGSGTPVAATVGLAMFTVVLAANALGLRLSARFQLLLAAVLTLVIAIAVAVALPSRGGRNWAPFAPHGWWAVGTAANILVWLFVGWEAVAQLAGDFRDPPRQLPRAMAIAFVVVTILYVSLAVATVGVTAGSHSRVPLADLIAVGFGTFGRDATAVLALALTMGTMNVYLGGAAKLAAALGETGSLPRWLASGAPRTIPRRPLVGITVIVLPLFAALVAGFGSPSDLVRATSACFAAVYVAATASALRILRGRGKVAAGISCALVSVVAVFSGWFLLVPAVSATAFGLWRRGLRRAAGDPAVSLPRAAGPG
jgi:amino acid efflux transporter